MALGTTLLLGAIAGVTILLGLPVARIRRLSPSARLLLTAVTVGILVFLVWDVLTHAWEPIDAQLGGTVTIALVPLVAVFVVGLALGLLSIAFIESRSALRRARAATDGLTSRGTALVVAVGIGVHNLAEGLAIGQASASGALGRMAVLVVGFALHNGTEGFGIVAPLAADPDRPTWRLLLGRGLIGGVPTYVGTAIGWFFTSDLLSVLFLTVAAGSILFVIMQLLGVAARARRSDLLSIGVLGGVLLGFATDAVVTLGGA
ncbi:ZIP family metal transporter [Amnibacterium sp.]|uniref:ZIP family metal transporter n=1 Tax=Amnibacterium sp. TaxID=1872496 RepID=UPI003F7B743B